VPAEDTRLLREEADDVRSAEDLFVFPIQGGGRAQASVLRLLTHELTNNENSPPRWSGRCQCRLKTAHKRRSKLHTRVE
jgi:hypothetical protein